MILVVAGFLAIFAIFGIVAGLVWFGVVVLCSHLDDKRF